MSALFMLAVIPIQLSATTEIKPVSIEATVPSESEVAATLNARLIEIQAMDMSTKNRAEKKALRNEVRAIRGELKTNNGGVYISVGAIIIILLLLILLL